LNILCWQLERGHFLLLAAVSAQVESELTNRQITTVIAPSDIHGSNQHW